jgi:hypothetical protein
MVLRRKLPIRVRKIVERPIDFHTVSRHHVTAVGERNKRKVGEAVLDLFNLSSYRPSVPFLSENDFNYLYEMFSIPVTKRKRAL